MSGKEADAGGKAALIVVDVQNDFMPPGGSLAVGEGDLILDGVSRMVELFGNAGAEVVYTQDWHPSDHVSFASNHDGKAPFETLELEGGPQVMWPDHCVQGSAGAEFHPRLRLWPDVASATVVRKGTDVAADSYSGFRDNNRAERTGLGDLLCARGVTRVVCVGLAFDYCVGFTALDAVDEGFADVSVVEELTRPVAADSAADMKRRLAAAGVRLVSEADARP